MATQVRCAPLVVCHPSGDCVESRFLRPASTAWPRERCMGKPIAARITGVAGYVPPRVLNNADLEKMVDTTDAWIRERTGIAERHIAEKGVATSHLAPIAAR